MTPFLIEYDCGEYAICTAGSAMEAFLPDNLGCLPVSVSPASEHNITEMWEKDGVLRCQVKNWR